tara:strand:- start:3971 stop:5056 length:1086 start_codon:yes stop_codon:yes gene_type:complete
MKKHNFSAGPSILESNVIRKASQGVLEINNTALSILEISHRSSEFIQIIEEAKTLTKELLNIGDDYEILFLQGGASLQFYMAALNFSRPNGTAAYIDTGTWSKKAIEESEKIGKTITVASSKDKNYTYIPHNININNNIDYLHFTSNNTIYGTQFHSFHKLSQLAKQNSAKLICDMSSDIFSKQIDVNQFDLIYAGAQKNLGPAGATLVIIKKESLINNGNLPTYLNYNTHIDKKSMFNTPPVFSIYVSMLTLRWLKSLGGIKSIEQENNKKASLLYNEIDNNPLFVGIVNKEDRSKMNVTFDIRNADHKLKFEKLCLENGINGIYGHRSVGGYRASIYNALKISSVCFLIELMRKLKQII